MEGSRPPPPTRSRHRAAPPNAQTTQALIPPTAQHQPQQLWQLAPVYHEGGYAINVLQPYGWQQMPSGQGQPHQAPRGKQKKPRRQFKRRHSNQHEADTGMPSLSSLRKENRAKARKYFAQGKQRFNPPASVPRTTPRTVPRAPENTTTYLISGHAHDHEPDGNVYGASDGAEGDGADGDATAIDFFGTNQGLITRALASDDDDGSAPDEDEVDDEKNVVHPALLGKQHVPRHIAQQLQEQASYITQLEDENLNLRERQLQELQVGGPPPSSGDEADEAGSTG